MSGRAAGRAIRPRAGLPYPDACGKPCAWPEAAPEPHRPRHRPLHGARDAEDDVGSYLLYRMLAELPDGPEAPAIGLIRAPQPADERLVRKGVKAAASAMARRMSPLAKAS